MRLRRSMLYIPGNNPGMLTDGEIYGADSIMIDLEDSIPVSEKDVARIMTFNALKNLRNSKTEIIVRINGLDTPFGREDIKAVVHGGVHVIRLPKTESKEDLLAVEKIVEETEKQIGIQIGTTKLMAAVESPLGVLNALEIATATPRLIGIALGAEDFVTSMKTNRTPSGIEILVARSQILMAARIAGIAAVDTVYSDVNNSEGFLAEATLIKELGFDGKSVIHPTQVKMVHDVFKPTQKEINHAKEVLIATEEAARKGVGVITVNGKMVDKPMIERADRVIMLAAKTV